jgi:pimeloyl-ACP methyl ester carboxylesterase
MPLIVLARWTLSLASLVLLGVGAYLLWSWWDGAWVVDPTGVAHHLREPWRLWTGLGLLAWSLVGRWPITWLLAKPDSDPTRPQRGDHQMIVSPTGSTLYVEISGPADAPPVILTHGWGLDSTIWYYLRRDLAKRFRVIVWDLPGLGRSRAASGKAIDLTHFAQDLKALLSLTGGKPVVLVGHSIGGMTLQTLVRDHPEVLGGPVAGLVLVNTTYTNPLRTMALSRLAQALRWPVLEPMFRMAIWLQPLAWLSAWQSYLSGSAHMANRLGFADEVTRSQLEHNTLLATRNPPAASARGNLAMFRWDAQGALQGVTAPILILAGDSDLVTKREASQTLAGAAPASRLEVISNANHMGFLERSALYNPHIEDFCERAHAQAALDREPTRTQA